MNLFLYQLPNTAYFKLDYGSRIFKKHFLEGVYCHCSDLNGVVQRIAAHSPVYQLSPDEVAVYIGEIDE